MKPPSAPVRIMAAAALLSLALVGLVVREGVARETGREVELAITGYDPQSLLSGHYVRFQISSDYPLGTRCPPGSGDESRRADGWVALRRQADHYAATGAALDRRAAQTLGEVVVRGDIACLRGPAPEATRVVLNLGLDRLYTDQAQAAAIQKRLAATPNASATARAVISVGADGKARLKGLIVDGKRINLHWL